MKTNHIRVLSVVAITSAGICGCRTAGRLELTITGVAAESSVPGEYAFVNLAQVQVDRRPANSALSFSPGELIETDQVVKLTVSKPPRINYKVLLGPDLISGETGEAWIVTSDPSVHLASGWAYLWDREALAETRWVSVIPDGTTLAVQVVDDTHHRAFFIAGVSLDVTCKYGGGGTLTLNAADTFVEASYAGGACVLTGPTDVAADPAASQFLAEVKSIATAAGWIP